MNTPTIWNPLRDLENMHDRLLRVLNVGNNRAGSDGQQSLTTAEWAPSVDISEDENEYLIKAELPEVKKDDVKITVENGVLTLKGERRFESESKDKKFHRIERGYGSFLRTFSMPDDADPDKVSAEFKDGVLRVTLGKSEAKKPRQIEVSVN
jgi:HSP20 family protein